MCVKMQRPNVDYMAFELHGPLGINNPLRLDPGKTEEVYYPSFVPLHVRENPTPRASTPRKRTGDGSPENTHA